MNTQRYFPLLPVLVMVLLLALTACTASVGTAGPASPTRISAVEPSSGVSQSGTPLDETGQVEMTPEGEMNPEGEATPTPLPPSAVPIHMFGRSVTYNWFSHWGWEWDDLTPVVKGRYVLYHHSIDSPENMFNSLRDIVETLPADSRTVIWWKFCFDDFSGAEEAQSSIQRNEQIVQQVYRYIVEQKRYRLIIGNALPKVAQDVDAELVSAQRQYNAWLNDFQRAHSGKVFVLDLYAVLADASGAERANFATARDDSHPNAAGYRALDAVFFPFLDRNIN